MADDGHYTFHGFPDAIPGSPSGVGSGSGSDDERNDIVLFDGNGGPLVSQRYKRQIGFVRSDPTWRQHALRK